MRPYHLHLALSAFLLCLVSAQRVRAARVAPAEEPPPAGQLEQLAVQKFGQLTEAEARLLRAVPSGKTAWCGPNDNPADLANDTAKAGQWGRERVIRSELIRWLYVDATASKFIPPNGLRAAGARLDGKLDLSFLDLRAPLTLRRCSIAEGVDLSSAQTRTLSFAESSTGAISAAHLSARGDLILRDGTFAAVNLSRAQVEGDLVCSGGRFDAGDVVFNGFQSAIGGNASFSEGFETNGVVDFSLTKIGGNLSFYDARFSGGEKNGLAAVSAGVAGALYWVEVKLGAQTQLDLTQAKVGALWDDEPSWPRSGNLLLDGFVYDNIVGPSDAESRLDWLDRQPKSFWPQPYRQLAKVLEEGGEEADAAEVMVAKEDALRRFGGLSFGSRVWKLILKMTIGYGYKPLRALWWIVSFVMVGAVVFDFGYRAGAIVPTEEHAHRSLLETGKLPASYQPFNATIFSLEHFLPLVELFQKEYWLPNPASGSNREVFGVKFNLGALIRWYILVHILAGWTLTPLFLAGLSGMVRPG